MPNITLGCSYLVKEQKDELIKRLSEVASDVTKIPVESFVVFLNEHNPENIGVGGVALSERIKN